jgi:hypothetical protein
MPRRLYVIDVAVRDFPAAADTFTQLFGVAGIPMWEDYEPSGGTDGIHFQLGGLDAFGLLSPRTPVNGATAQRLDEQIERRGEGVTITAFVAEDLAEIEPAYRAQGGRFVYPEAIRVGDELLNMLELCGVDIGFAHHDPGHWEKWRAGQFHGTAAAPQPRTEGHRVLTCHSIEFVTSDLARTSGWFATITGAEGTPGKADTAAGHPVVDFPLDGLERLRVIGPVDPPAADDPIARHLAERGEGVRTIGLRVTDPAASQRILEGAGFGFETTGASAGPVTTAPICGVRFELTA